MPHLNELNKYLRMYLICGGYLKPMYEFLANNKISEEIYEIYVRWVLGDLSKFGKKERLFRSVINGVIKRYSSSYSLNAIAKEMEIPTHSTLSEYLDVL
jgi:predicted AAA+ superfamily ATPase